MEAVVKISMIVSVASAELFGISTCIPGLAGLGGWGLGCLVTRLTQASFIDHEYMYIHLDIPVFT